KEFPRGHPDLASSLNDLAVLLEGQGEYGKALGYSERALAMIQRLYPEQEYPRGHPQLASSLNNLALVLNAQGQYGKALGYYERALAMWQRLYPEKEYPRGHPDLAAGLNNLGFSLQAQEGYVKALGYHEQSLAMQQKLLQDFADLASEAEALGMGATLPLTRDALLSVSARVGRSDARVYQHVWQSKAVLTRILERRHLALFASKSRGAWDKWQTLLDARRQIDQVLALPTRDAAARDRDRDLRGLTEQKERLERELADLLPQLPRRQELDDLGPGSLRKHLPARTAFVDLLRYTHFEYDASKPGKKGERRADHYVAFVLLPGQAARRVELGAAEPIERALAQWRQALEEGKDGEAAKTVRRLVWQPMRLALPDQTETVYLSPDGDLTRLPWAALPGDKDGSVVLEEYTLAVVPHGPFLLERLLFPPKPASGPGLLLASGGIRYGDEPRPKQGYDYLPGTEGELRRVIALAGRRPTVALDGEAATVGQLTAELSRARWAHLATHGFFDEAAYRDEQKRIAKLWETWRFQAMHTTEQVGLRMRSPLGFTGLVLAGANRHDHGDSGILTGEGLVELRLEGLELVVLSACETGLGTVTGGEGVFGLQRAFHVAGAKNVVASLWQVPDVPTLVLMEEFYKRLWDKDKPVPAMQALRQAQLEVLRHPERVLKRAEELRTELAKRGLKPGELGRRGFAKVLGKLPEGGRIEERRRSPALWWAAFVCSGCADAR
ncbi:MAG TPA: CHAT domain-containing tetratricopeptide repeat protein, partial [Gemmataceae bacterium]|nr:CHAT domain-containing tetratricopeptide repeat protein [Gemmataceae bacterium]